MPSSYTANLGLELPASGEKTGTWGLIVNEISNTLDKAVSGIHTEILPAAGSSGSPNTMTITDGASSDASHMQWVITDGGDLGATAYLQLNPNDAKRICYIRNSLSGSRSLVVFQGTYNASNVVTIAAGEDAVVAFDGGGASAVAKRTLDKPYFTSVNTASFSINGSEVTVSASEINSLSGLTATASELNILDGATVTTAELNKLDGLTATTTELNILDGVIATTAEINKLSGVTASTAEINYLDGVTSNIQTQLDSAGVEITGAATTIVSSNLTPSRAVISNASGKVEVSAVTSTELGYLDGVTSNIQTQINALAGGGGGTWGSITGTLSDQTDLQAALDDKMEKGVKPVVNLGDVAVSGSQTVSVDLSTGDFFVMSMNSSVASGTLTIDFTNIPDTSSGQFSWHIHLVRGGVKTVAFADAVNWAGGVMPTFNSTSNSFDVLMFYKLLGGTIRGMLVDSSA